MAWLALIVLAVGGLVAFLGKDAGTLVGLDDSALISLVAGAALIVFFVASLAGSYRGRLGQAVRDFAVWCLMAVALVALYSYRTEFTQLGQRLAGELMPPGDTMVVEGTQTGERAVRIRRRGDGHFVAKVAINGNRVAMLVDTGATSLVLRPQDARQAGIDVDRLRYTIPVQTANGPALAAPIKLRSVGIGPIAFDGVDALVAKPGALRESLLGMSFLRRLRSYEFSGEFLTLRG
jgi:aspartyl protease family protein